MVLLSCESVMMSVFIDFVWFTDGVLVHGGLAFDGGSGFQLMNLVSSLSRRLGTSDH